MELLQNLPYGLLEFMMVVGFSLLIGIEQRRLHGEEKALFGTDRTFTFIGVLGYIGYILQPDTMYLFAGGGLAVVVLLAIFYYHKVRVFKDFGLTSVTIALITYALAPLVFTQPKWLTVLVVIAVLIFTELKPTFMRISNKLGEHEFITLGKFLAIIGVILPVVPDEPVFDFMYLTPYKVWLAVVVVSTISYLSYLLQKFVFPRSGILISGILGGLYSSTATTMILARKSRSNKRAPALYIAAILLAIAMMFVRLLILVGIFNMSLALDLLLWFAILFIITLAISGYFIRQHQKVKEKLAIFEEEGNPLELQIASIFAVLFVVFSFATHFTLEYFGTTGLQILSFIVGLTHLDPFLINLFQGKYEVSQSLLAIATLQAVLSNNILKGLYAALLGSKEIKKPVAAGLGIVIAANILILLLLI